MHELPVWLRLTLASIGCVAGTLGGGCGTTPSYAFKVDAMARPMPSGAQAYRLKSKDPRLGDESLRYREAAEMVRTALSGKGLYEAASEDRADLIVDLEFGMEPVVLARDRGAIPSANPGIAPRSVAPPAGADRGSSPPRAEATPRGSPAAPSNPAVRTGVYAKFLRISAREARPSAEGKPPAEIWNIQITAEDDSNDLRRYLPVMAAATIDLIGRDTSGQRTVRLQGDSPTVEFIRQGLSSEPAPVAPTAR